MPSDTNILQQTPFNLRFVCVWGFMSIQPLYGAANAPYLKSSERQNSTHLTFLKHQNTKTSHYKLSLIIIGLLHFVNFLGPSEKIIINIYVYNIFCPLAVCWEGEKSFVKKNAKKNSLFWARTFRSDVHEVNDNGKYPLLPCLCQSCGQWPKVNANPQYWQKEK